MIPTRTMAGMPAPARWVQGLQVPALALAHGVVVAANGHAARLWQADGRELEGRPIRTLLQTREPPAGPAARRARRVAGGAARVRAVRVITLHGRGVAAELHTLAHAADRELVVVLEQQGLHRRQRELMRQMAVLAGRAAGQAIDHERHCRHVGSQLHDHVQQVLVAAQLDLHRALGQLQTLPAEAAGALQRTAGRMAEALQATRRIADELSPPLLADLGLVPALEGLADRVEAATGLRVVRDWADAEGAAAMVGRLRATALYRAAEECLRLIARASPAATACVSLRGFGDHGLVLSVHSADAGPVDLGARLAGLHEWIRELHGELAFTPAGVTPARMALRLDFQPDPLLPRATDAEMAALLGLFHRLPVGVIEMDAQGNVQTMNPAAARRLLPLVHPRPLANLVDALGAALPDLRRALAEAGGRAELRFTVPDAGHGPVHLGLHAQSGARWLVTLT